MAVVVGLVMLGLRWSAVLESITFIHPGAKQFATPRGVEDVFFESSDGVKLHGWFMPARGRPRGPANGLSTSGPAPAVLHCHGNEASVDAHASWSDFICEHGVSVFVFDYRSFGRSQDAGRMLTRKHLMRDSRAAYAYLASRADVDPKRIGVYGVSLGGTFALELAAEHPEIRAVATVCTFSSWPAVAADYAPVIGRLLIETGMAQVENVKRLGTRPLLLVHGNHDTIVSYQHAGVLLKAAEEAGVRARLIGVVGADHLDVLTRRPGVMAEIGAFFGKELGAE